MNVKSGAKGVYIDLATLLQTRHRAKKLKLFARRPAKSLLLGETRSRFRGRGMEFEEVRHYQPGDDIRSIDWRVSARTGKTHTKLYSEERERPVYLIIDQRNSMFFGSTYRFKSVFAAEIAAYLAWAALLSSDRIGAQIFNDTDTFDIKARRNRQAVLKMLHNIHHCNQLLPKPPEKTAVSLSAVLEQSRRIVRPGSSLFIISDCHDLNDEAAKQLRLLRQHNDISIIQVSDPLEEAFPDKLPTQSVLISNGNKPRDVLISNSTVKRYNQKQSEFRETVKALCQRHRIHLINASCKSDPFETLYQVYN